MKCRYSYCKHNGEVNKEEAIKEGNSYFHKDCYEEKQLKQKIEEYYILNMPQCTLQLLRKVIKQLIHEKGNEAKYIMFVLEYIYNNKKPINNPFGLVNYCNDERIKNEFKKSIIKKQYEKMNKSIEIDISINKNGYKYKSTNKKITDII